jgi:hypothetical protein
MSDEQIDEWLAEIEAEIARLEAIEKIQRVYH